MIFYQPAIDYNSNIFPLSTEKCKQLGENEIILEQISSDYNLVQKHKQHVDNEYSTLKMKNEDLNDSLSRALEQRDLARSELHISYTQLEAMKNDKNETEEILRSMSLC